MSSMYRGSRLRSTLNTSYIRFGHVSSMYRGSRLRSTSYRPRKNAKTLPRFSGRRQKQPNTICKYYTYNPSYLYAYQKMYVYILNIHTDYTMHVRSSTHGDHEWKDTHTHTPDAPMRRRKGTFAMPGLPGKCRRRCVPLLPKGLRDQRGSALAHFSKHVSWMLEGFVCKLLVTHMGRSESIKCS